MRFRQYIIPSLFVVCVIILLSVGPIRQNPLYHNFADERKMLGIPNFLNVITNLPFLLFAVYGLREARKLKEKQVKHISIMLFIGFILLTFGSGYYHWSPGNISLVYDRIPIAVVIMSLLAYLNYDVVNEKVGYRTFIILNIIGVCSVIYWIYTEKVGKGDLRWYVLVQFFPVIAIPLILLLYQSPFNYRRQVTFLFIFFVLAKLAETFDGHVYRLLNNIISGHSVKHLLMVGAEYQIVMMVRKRISCMRSNLEIN